MAKVDDSAKGRICSTEGCATRLSRYNPGKHCFAHDDPRDAERSNAYTFRLEKEIKQELNKAGRRLR